MIGLVNDKSEILGEDFLLKSMTFSGLEKSLRLQDNTANHKAQDDI